MAHDPPPGKVPPTAVGEDNSDAEVSGGGGGGRRGLKRGQGSASTGGPHTHKRPLVRTRHQQQAEDVVPGGLVVVEGGAQGAEAASAHEEIECESHSASGLTGRPPVALGCARGCTLWDWGFQITLHPGGAARSVFTVLNHPA